MRASWTGIANDAALGGSATADCQAPGPQHRSDCTGAGASTAGAQASLDRHGPPPHDPEPGRHVGRVVRVRKRRPGADLARLNATVDGSGAAPESPGAKSCFNAAASSRRATLMA